MTKRRDVLKFTALAGGSLAINPRLLMAATTGDLITRAIPSSGEELPVVGLGSSATFSRVARSNDVSALREVFSALFENGGTVFDTAPGYGASEETSGQIVSELGAREKVFWATKLNVAGRRGGKADPEAARKQVEDSYEYIGKTPIDAIQVHNLGDVPTQLPILKELKAEGRLRYIGVTSTRASNYSVMEEIMRNEPLDFIGVDYAIDNREAANSVLPLAMERGIGVLVYLPFGRTRLWNRVSGQELPAWASEIDASTWAQFFLKYLIANPAVTVVTPATSKAHHMVDNLGGARGRLPDKAMLKRMEDYVEALPSA
jgi:aryl-alcohol dehydrogenase-like predicted oxidoreductase